ncbi:TIGR03915 family putative DNA repair protein [Hymenobacter sediminicola]|uniref:TIGR03915 family putative DNA repair protein n=1 Tax=Hymenobacter sediminicola TaxID=2761579 RepID=A0A7G7W5E7_9BACT|nr:TIGR03915 family putative DNA repair protein [Hymenobacter sediminicola]QNH61590.1 TIGR03915 family putative DNA repair protein [Hymenobacter sediminicola]
MSHSLSPLNRPCNTAVSSAAGRRSGAPQLTNPALDYSYDGSFEGMLTVLFQIYDRKAAPNTIQPVGAVQGGLFVMPVEIDTDETAAARVWEGLLRYMDAEARTRLFHTFLSEQPDRELLIFRYADLAMRAGRDISENYADDNVRRVQRLAQQMYREKHRMEAFVRFEKTQDGLFHSTIDPDFDVLPLIAPHFTKRYADQRWLIFDKRRRYGLYYDLTRTDIVEFETSAPQRSTAVSATVLDEREPLFKLLWQSYFDHVNIPERKNMKLHRRHMPLRYWRYLSEKQPREQRFEPIRNKRPVQPGGPVISSGESVSGADEAGKG